MNWTKLADQLAEEAGVKPSPWKYVLTDPSLALRLICGTTDPASFRLQGPGKWAGARNVIVNSYSEMMSYVSPDTQVSSAVSYLHTCVIVMACICAIITFIFMYLMYTLLV